MRIVPFPGDRGAPVEEAWLGELEAALEGTAEGPAAESWRELRADVRALASPISSDFERELAARLSDGRSPRRRLPAVRLPRPSGRTALSLAAGVGVVIAAIAIAVSGLPHRASPAGAPSARRSQMGPAQAGPAAAGSAGASASPRGYKAPAEGSAIKGPLVSAPAEGSGAAAASAPAAAPGRVQQLGASVTLAPSAANVQATADGVSRVVVDDGGYVQSSHVQVQQVGASEASMMLSVPSEKLGVALASIAQIAPVRAESQSLQDITSSYDAARQRLADANAEHRALLRALAAATSEQQIASLREQLSQSAAAIAHAHASLDAISHRASNSELEVTVLGNAHASSEGLTLARGLHDAGSVLSAVLAGLLIAAAVLVPLAVLLLALLSARRAWRRYRREHALDGS